MSESERGDVIYLNPEAKLLAEIKSDENLGSYFVEAKTQADIGRILLDLYSQGQVKISEINERNIQSKLDLRVSFLRYVSLFCQQFPNNESAKKILSLETERDYGVDRSVMEIITAAGLSPFVLRLIPDESVGELAPQLNDVSDNDVVRGLVADLVFTAMDDKFAEDAMGYHEVSDSELTQNTIEDYMRRVSIMGYYPRKDGKIFFPFGIDKETKLKIKALIKNGGWKSIDIN